MKTIKAIQTRRSVRSFKTKKPDWRDIIEAINSARYAPMAGDVFHLKFLIIYEQELIEKISKWAEQSWINEAKYLVAFISDTKKVETLYKERAKKYSYQQTGAAIQNFMLHLHSIGLSTCWVGHYNDEKIKNLLKIPEDKELEAIIPVGYQRIKPNVKKEKGNSWKGLYFNEWGNGRMKEIKKVEGRGPGYY
jgi:nitroreductase